MNIAVLSRQIENLIRIGTVIEVDLSKQRCRVKSGALETEWLAMPSIRAGATRKWSPLTVDEQVMILSPSGVIEAGIVLPMGIFSAATTPPSTSADVEMTEYPDGAVTSYNHTTHELTVGGIEKLNIVANTKVSVIAPEIEILSADGAPSSGVVTKDCTCSYTGAPHPQGSMTLKASA